MQSQFINKPTIYYPPFINTTNTSFNPQHNDSLNINNVQDIPVVLDNLSQVSAIDPITTLFTTPPTLLNMNDQAMASNYILQPMQDHQVLHSSLLAHSQVMSEYSFFYTPCNDFQIYHIICKEISFSFESMSQLISNTDNNKIDSNYVKPNNIYVFYHELPEIKKIYKVTCEMVPHTFIFQFLNKVIYNIEFIKCEHQKQEFSIRHQENLKLHLKKDLIHYLVPKNVHEDNYNLHKRFIQDYYIYESMTNSNTSNNFQQCNTDFVLPFDQSYTSQQDNNNQVNYNNYGN
ncbi:hypothetical protein RhiirA5_400956 [Rhizophagus irregularis]|uniref:Uncharacterized protein n=1 Tax=Rhizophagus irregularis TaxID=588596 RepID=A0A2N0PF24_9GLOM|nr:hypothetical protein RhiirA5_400956 [Rhizophagus irregularis]CAB5186662.1 unnamed protein product [Rhizophagus irregularis]